ncbi:MAG: hypothetical protein HY675_20475 [Chloroflexi bacterium]|nr:hypothetical protein [Chloroflexota bacterium]
MGIESIVKQLITDRSFRDEVAKDPDTVLGRFELSAAERKSLVRMCRNMAASGGPSSVPLRSEGLVWY